MSGSIPDINNRAVNQTIKALAFWSEREIWSLELMINFQPRDTILRVKYQHVDFYLKSEH